MCSAIGSASFSQQTIIFIVKSSKKIFFIFFISGKFSYLTKILKQNVKQQIIQDTNRTHFVIINN